jgi:hypothetical protein
MIRIAHLFFLAKKAEKSRFGTVTGDSAGSCPRPNVAPSRHPLSVGLSDLRSCGGGRLGSGGAAQRSLILLAVEGGLGALAIVLGLLKKEAAARYEEVCTV